MTISLEMTEKIEKNYEQLLKEVPELKKEIEERILKEEKEVALYLKYLYANMPLSDAVDYPYEMFRSFAVYGVELRNRTEWTGKQDIPEDIFLDYVLFHRVNTESITFCREGFGAKLSERVQGKSMEEAILEANYWCAEEATYQSTDERTMSAEGVYKGAFGRCGEESVFTVNVLRSIGIPARQVYAQRWAHCDDNHAWVEVWCDGEWYFLGACEPEEILNLGWFIHASSRAMMVNSRIYGSQTADGVVIEKDGITSGINQLERYAKTTELHVKVIDENGDPVEGAQVRYELLNYAELVPIAFGRTDASGNTVLKTGLGSLHIVAIYQGKSAETVVDVRLESSVELRICKERSGKESWKAFDMNAPHDFPINTRKPSEEQRRIGKKKFDAAVEKRLQKVSRFPKEDEGEFYFRSRGNAKEIKTFLESASGEEAIKIRLLKQLSLKDFRDCKADILEEHLRYAAVYEAAYEQEVFDCYVLNPRISFETLSTYRECILQSFSKEEQEAFREDPRKIWDWVKTQIREVNHREYLELFTTPKGCMIYRLGSKKSKKILFVAICRSLGVPARLHPVTLEMQYYNGAEFQTVTEETTVEGSATISICIQDQTRWVYMQNWTIARRGDGEQFQTLQVGEGYQGEITLQVEAGDYRVITSNRLPNGNQFAASLEFSVLLGETKEIPLKLREAKLEDMLEAIPLDTFSLKDEKGESVSVETCLQDGMQLFIWTEAGKEPTEHILNEIRERKEEFAKLGERLHLILQDVSDLEDPTFQRTKKELPNARILYDNNRDNINVLARRMYGDPDKLPLIIVIDEKQNGIYSTGGYNVGTGDMLLRIMNQ